MCPSPRMSSSLAEAEPAASSAGGETKIPLTVTVAGGKGGVGKTSLALNLAMVLARQGYRTLLLDGDLELANVNVMLGLYPKVTLEDAISGKLGLDQVLVRVADNLDLLPGASGVENCLNGPVADQRRFLRQLAELESRYDRVVVDTAAGLGSHAMHMIAAAHLTLLVITPDPTSLTDAFSLLKLLHRRGYRRQPDIVVNMVRGLGQARSIHQRFAAAVQRYLNLDCHYLGAIWRDESIAQSIISQKPVAMLPDTDPSCRQFWTLADMLAVRWSQGTPRALGFSRYWIRLLERKRAESGGEPGPKVPVDTVTVSPKGEADSAGAPQEQSWPAHFRAWLEAPQIDPVERYHRVSDWLALLGESLDEDMIETLQTGLSNMPWQDLPAPLRQSAAAHFRQLADLVAPAPKAAPELQSQSQEPHRYASDVYGSQDALLNELRQHPSNQSLSRILEQLRETENSLRHPFVRRGSGGNH